MFYRKLTNITRQTVATQGMPTYGGITAVLVGTTSTPAISRPSSRRQFEIILLYIILTQKPDMDTTVEDPTTFGITTPIGTNYMMSSETITFQHPQPLISHLDDNMKPGLLVIQM